MHGSGVAGFLTCPLILAAGSDQARSNGCVTWDIHGLTLFRLHCPVLYIRKGSAYYRGGCGFYCITCVLFLNTIWGLYPESGQC